MGFIDTLMLGYFCRAYEVGIYNLDAELATNVRIVPMTGTIYSLFGNCWTVSEVSRKER